MSTVKVNKITPRTSNSIQLGESGDTLTIPSGATLQNCGTATGFGISFCTTTKTSPFTATAGKGFFINTGSAVTVTLPASPSVGDELIVVDSTGCAATNNITLGRNGSKIRGQCQDASLIVNRGGLRMVYSGSSQGWVTATAGNDATASQARFTTATGGTITTSGDYKIHTFTSDGCFAVTQAGNAEGGGDKVSYLVIAGGGGSGRYYGGGGGAGGYREGKCSSDPYTASPLAATPCSGLTISAQTYPITVGGGGSTGCGSPPYTNGDDGSNSVFSTITSAGGGGGAGGQSTQDPANAGGSGGGGHNPCSPSPAGDGRTGGAGNTPPVSPPQGNAGTTVTAPAWAGGGGGATSTGPVRVGGAGATSCITASPVGRAGGGSGGPNPGTGSPQPGAGGSSDGGGAYNTNGTVNTGGGGGSDGGSGASGIVVIRYKFQ